MFCKNMSIFIADFVKIHVQLANRFICLEWNDSIGIVFIWEIIIRIFYEAKWFHRPVKFTSNSFKNKREVY